MSSQDLREIVEQAAPALVEAMDELCCTWLNPVIVRLKTDSSQFRPKQINDPIWGSVELNPAEVALLDSPLLQRMRGVKQLGLAQLVFPSAGHDRLEHIVGVIGAIDRIADALDRQISRWNKEHRSAGEQITPIDPPDRHALRIAALFHDLGHGPFSHAVEPVLDVTSPLGVSEAKGASSWRHDLAGLRRRLTSVYSLNGAPATSEVLAVTMVLSKAAAEVLAQPLFVVDGLGGRELQERIVACIIGGVEGPGATHLSTIISGQVDADRLDYLSRDAHHAGLQIGFDTSRLLSRLEVLQVRDSQLKTTDVGLRTRIANAPHGVFQQIGIAASGYGSFEQMLIGRTFLYDRLYHHHKVRAAEAMAQRMLLVAERDRGRRFELSEIFLSVGDDTFIRLLAEEITHPGIAVSSAAAAGLARGILDRNLLHRAFAFRGRFISSPPGLSVEVADANRDSQWRSMVKSLAGLQGRYDVGQEIHALATTILDTLAAAGEHGDLTELTAALARCGPEQVIVDLPMNKAAAIRILARYPDGSLKVPEFSFNPVKWTDAYDLQKRTGYVFCPKDVVGIIALAARIVFLERYGVAMGRDADGYIKTGQALDPHWLVTLLKAKLLDQDTVDTLTEKRHSLLRIRDEDLGLPDEWIVQDPDIAPRLAGNLNRRLRGGLTSDGLAALSATLRSLWRFVDGWYSGQRLTGDLASEGELQTLLAEHLRMTLEVVEGAEVGGGELDLYVARQVMVENKFHSRETKPTSVANAAGMQGRRYALALNSQVVIVMSAYRMSSNDVVPEKHSSVSINTITRHDGNRAEIRFDLPFGAPKPSDEKREKPSP